MTINTKKEKGNSILILECPLMILTELAIITGLFYGSFLNAVIFLVKINDPFQPDLWFSPWFMIYGSKRRDFVRDHGLFFLDGSKIVRPSISMNISFI